MAGTITVDESRAPIVVVTYPATVTADAYRDVFARYLELSARHPCVAYLIDFQQFDPVAAPPSLRRAAAAIFQEYQARLARVTVCEARLVKNPLSRGILTAFDWITPGKWPCANFSSSEAATAWITGHLEASAGKHRGAP